MKKLRPIRRLLIANRGEIALRVIRACREMGIASIAVFSEIDRRSLHVLSADEAYALGGSTPRESYLNQAKILEIARVSSADAIHPGYGFLAENAVFADAVERDGLVFVGPSGQSVRMMGDKTEARKVARQLGIPTIRGTVAPIEKNSEGIERAQEIGYPVLLKAAAGGGERVCVSCVLQRSSRQPFAWPNLKRREHSAMIASISRNTSILPDISRFKSLQIQWEMRST